MAKSLCISPGCENNYIPSGQNVDFNIDFEIRKGTATPNPASFKYTVIMSSDGNVNNADNKAILAGAQTHSVGATHTIACKLINLLYYYYYYYYYYYKLLNSIKLY